MCVAFMAEETVVESLVERATDDRRAVDFEEERRELLSRRPEGEAGRLS